MGRDGAGNNKFGKNGVVWVKGANANCNHYKTKLIFASCYVLVQHKCWLPLHLVWNCLVLVDKTLTMILAGPLSLTCWKYLDSKMWPPHSSLLLNCHLEIYACYAWCFYLVWCCLRESVIACYGVIVFYVDAFYILHSCIGHLNVINTGVSFWLH